MKNLLLQTPAICRLSAAMLVDFHRMIARISLQEIHHSVMLKKSRRAVSSEAEEMKKKKEAFSLTVTKSFDRVADGRGKTCPSGIGKQYG